LLTGDLNTKIGMEEINNIAGSFREPLSNTEGLKLRDGATYSSMKIINSVLHGAEYFLRS